MVVEAILAWDTEHCAASDLVYRQCAQVLSKWRYFCRRVREVVLWPKSDSQPLRQMESKFPMVRWSLWLRRNGNLFL